MKKLKLTKLIASSLIVVLALALNPIKANAEWRQNSAGWWYAEGDSWAIGWRNIDGNWYYFYSDGYMATNNKIDGYFVNSTGAWTNSITTDEARQLILNEDGNYISKFINKNTRLSTDYIVHSDGYMTKENYWSDFPRELYYEFDLSIYDNNGEVVGNDCEYLVGMESKNVYVLASNGTTSIYQIENNQKVKTFKWTHGGNSYEWR